MAYSTTVFWFRPERGSDGINVKTLKFVGGIGPFRGVAVRDVAVRQKEKGPPSGSLFPFRGPQPSPCAGTAFAPYSRCRDHPGSGFF